MIKREIKLPPRESYPVDPWKFVQKKIVQDLIGRDEAIFAVSNGYIGIRGSFEEDEPVQQRATFINGFHETWPITYGEEAFGFAKTGQTMIPVTDASVVKLFIDDEGFSLRHAYLTDFDRNLDFRDGVLRRSLIWDTAAGKQVKIESERLVSFPERHMAAVKYSITVLNADAHIALFSDITCDQISQKEKGDDPRMDRQILHDVYNPALQRVNGKRILLGHQTTDSQLKVLCGIDHEFEANSPFQIKVRHDDFHGRITYTGEAAQNQTITLYKYITYHTSSPVPSFEDLADRAEQTLDRAMAYHYDKLVDLQREYLDEFWDHSDIEIEANDPQVQQNLRLHLFHLLAASARVQNSGIGAKGLTGSGYEGHAFWDMEIYMLPFLIYSLPRVAKNLLIYRYNMLDKAREWAKTLNQEGAMFPWRTITGEEASAFFAAGTAQFHINADIAYAVRKYVEVTGDMEFLELYGAEILLETARLWADLGFFSKSGRFHIHGVTGPDEYSAIVNDNTFTNLMAKENMMYAYQVMHMLRTNRPEVFEYLQRKTKLRDDELDHWLNASDNMFVPYNEELGINPQDYSFLERERWDLENTPREKFPLLLHYHPLVLYRFQVIKQADVVMAMFLLDHAFDDDLKKRNFDYYDPLTTGDSSLSASIQAIVANELGYADLATRYFTYAMFMDIADIGGNVGHGLHLASMGGIWMGVVYGVGGLRDHRGEMRFDPKLNHAITGVSFKLQVRGSWFKVEIMPDQTTYTLLKGEPVEVYHRGEKLTLSPGASVSRA